MTTDTRSRVPQTAMPDPPRVLRRTPLKRRIRSHLQLYILLALPLIWLAVFAYAPMAGIVIAFQKYNPVDGLFGSEWVGFDHFVRFFESFNFWRLIKNTVVLHLYELVVGFPLPIALALGLNALRSDMFRRSVQTITYAPHFISTVVIVGLIVMLLDPQAGVINQFLGLLGIDAINPMGDGQTFRHVYVWSGIWQSVGFSAIIYLAALAGVPPELHEAAIVDGASRLRRMWHIDIPSILPVMVILLILNIGSIMSVGFEKVLLMQNPLNLEASEVIDTYVYKVGLASALPQFSYAAAIGLFRSVIGMLLLVLANVFAKRVAKTGLW